jgi:hypothetical protein
MGLKRVAFVLVVLAVMHCKSSSVYAEGLGCDETPSGATVTCAEMISNAKDAIVQMQLRASATQAKQRRQCAGAKNKRLRKVKNFSARQMKASMCLQARNGSAATDILRAYLSLV